MLYFPSRHQIATLVFTREESPSTALFIGRKVVGNAHI